MLAIKAVVRNLLNTGISVREIHLATQSPLDHLKRDFYKQLKTNNFRQKSSSQRCRLLIFLVFFFHLLLY